MESIIVDHLQLVKGDEASTREYRAWQGMKNQRLNILKLQRKKGGRGITICEAWMDNYKTFLEDMGRCPDGYTLGRVDNNGDYTPVNCKWTSFPEQVRNRRSNRTPAFGKIKRMCALDWGKKLRLQPSAIYRLMNEGKTAEEIIEWILSKH